MNQPNLTSRRHGLLAPSVWLLTLGLVACGAPEADEQTPYTPTNGNALADAQAPAADAGAVIDAAVVSTDTGVRPVLQDAQIPMEAQAPLDAQAPGDAQVSADAGDAGVGGDASSEAGAPRADLLKGNGKDVICIGDSWMLLFGTGIQESLTKVSMQPYRKYARPGTKLLDGAIPGQYATAKRADPVIKTVVMTGGGNDIIQTQAIKNDCVTGGPLCQPQLDKIGQAQVDLWAQMSKDGVQDVIHVMYSASAGDGVKEREANNKKQAESCAAVPPPLRCHLLNTDMLIGPNDLLDDKIHPNDAGYDKIGKAVFDLMVKEGMRR